MLLAAATACSGSSTAPSAPSPTVITFSGLSAQRAPVGVYAESGYLVSSGRGDWLAWTDYGNPRPFIEFFSVTPNDATIGDVTVFAARHAPFRFRSVDLYSSVTPIPYSITGIRNDVVVFTQTDTLPNTFGNFRTVVNSQAAAAIDTLVVTLSNRTPICCNPMGLDNIVLE